MCQLLGMNCATPTDFVFSFRGFCRRGGETDKHEHGWGMAIYEGHGVRTFTDTLPAARSKVAAFVESYPIKTLNTMAHIRYATQGRVSLENVHPFQREMWGIIWTFAHNGEVPKFSNKKSYQEHPLLGRRRTSNLTNDRNEIFYHPVGDTDSEATFCAILNALRAEFTELPTLPVLYETLQHLCAQIVQGDDEELTILNFLLGCGPYTLFAYSWPGARPGSTVWNGLFYTIRKPPFSKARLADVDYSVDFSQVTSPNDRVAVIATAPLTVDEEWKEFRRGELLMFDNGLSYSELYDCLAVEKQGRGLYSKVMPKLQRTCSHDDDNNNADDAYDLPTQLRKLLDETAGRASYSRAADLGCGAGCSGLAFRSCCRHLTGVDLSPAMLEKAREVGCYDELALGDIESILHERETNGNGVCVDANEQDACDAGFDLVFACNVFVYIQDLRSVFEAVRKCLNGNGVFAFSAELLECQDDGDEPEPPFVLQSCARYAHKRRYIEDLVAELGFRTCAFKVSPLRKHEGRDVNGVLAIMSISVGNSSDARNY